MFQWLGTAGERLSRLTAALTRYPLTRASAVGLLFFFILVCIPLWLLITSSKEKERAVRQELYERDLKEITGRFDADERFVLANNFEQFLERERTLAPLLLPRPYYFGLPTRAALGPPRPPPRNCFVDLKPATGTGVAATSDRFCAYFVQDPAFGTQLFFAISLLDEDLVIHKIGDARLLADSLRIQITTPTVKATWSLTLQEPTVYLSPARYAMTAYVREGGKWERDKRFEGWAYTKGDEPSGMQAVTILAKLNYKALDSVYGAAVTDAIWPPPGARQIRFVVSRRNVSRGNFSAGFLPYADVGVSSLSLPSLYAVLAGTHASFVVRSKTNGAVGWKMTPEGRTSPSQNLSPQWARFSDGDLIFSAQDPMTSTAPLQDTDLVFEIAHPGTVIESAIWQTVGLLLFVILIFIALAAFFLFKVLHPIQRMARDAIALSKSSAARYLPYGNEPNEIGVLSKAFNDLLSRTRQQAEERVRRDALKQRREAEALKNREENLKTIGHEIRAPLQALLSLHPPGDEARRYVERMVRAVDLLFGATGPEAAFAGRQLILEKQKVGEFLEGLVANAHLAGIPNVRYFGGTTALYCSIDDNALEDAITHILTNANRFRLPSTPIDVSLAPEDSDALIMIVNTGPRIPADMVEAIFEYGVSLDPEPGRERRGQGLFVARSYIRKMGGDLSAHNLESGVAFEIRLPTMI